MSKPQASDIILLQMRQAMLFGKQNFAKSIFLRPQLLKYVQTLFILDEYETYQIWPFELCLANSPMIIIIIILQHQSYKNTMVANHLPWYHVHPDDRKPLKFPILEIVIL